MAEMLEIITERVLVLESGEIEIIAVAEQGPPGPPGIPGTEVTNIDCGTFN